MPRPSSANSEPHDHAPLERAKTITRRTAIGALAATSAAYALKPYTPRSRRSIPADQHGRTVLTYWEKWTGREGAAIQSVVDRFNQSQTRIWVHRVPVGDITSKAMVAIGGGDPPDLVGLFSFNIAHYAQARAIMPLDDPALPIDRLGAIDPTIYAPAVRRLLSFEGKQWAGVNTCSTIALYYNRGHLQKVGWDPDQPPATVNELDELAQRLTITDSQGSIQRAGFLQNIPGWWPYYWPVMFGGRLYDPIANKALIASPACVRAYEWVQSSAKRFGVQATRSFAAGFLRSNLSAQDPFISGKVSMVVQGPWMANFLNAYRPDLDYAAVPVPVSDPALVGSDPVGVLEADVIMIPRGCPHPAEAYEFFLFTQRQDVQEQLAIAHAKSSPMNTVSPDFMTNHPNRSVRTHDLIAKSPAVTILPQTRVWKQYSDMMISAFEAIWSGNDPAAELNAVQSRLQQVLDLAEARQEIRARREGSR
jgi:multiple sugar transport system substrate-binding protein